MTDIDEIKNKIADTEADIAEAKRDKDFARRDRLEALLTKQTGVWENLLAREGKYQLLFHLITLSISL